MYNEPSQASAQNLAGYVLMRMKRRAVEGQSGERATALQPVGDRCADLSGPGRRRAVPAPGRTTRASPHRCGPGFDRRPGRAVLWPPESDTPAVVRPALVPSRPGQAALTWDRRPVRLLRPPLPKRRPKRAATLPPESPARCKMSARVPYPYIIDQSDPVGQGIEAKNKQVALRADR